MGYDKAVHIAAHEKMQQRRARALERAHAHQEEIYQKIPQVLAIDQELAKTSLYVSRAVLNKRNDIGELIQGLRLKTESLQQKKEHLLLQHGYPADYLLAKFHCPKCEDRGYLQNGTCDCMKELLKQEAAARLSSVHNIASFTFQNFHVNLYSNQPDASGVVPRERMREILEYCQQYASTFSLASRNILMMGHTGLGKTHLSLAIANTCIQNGAGVVYASAQNILTKLEQERFNRVEASQDTFETITSCDLLILDDLGSEFTTQFTTSAVFNLLNSRILKGLPTIISTNLTPKELEERYTQRVASRLIGSFDILRFVGSDIRFILKKNQM